MKERRATALSDYTGQGCCAYIHIAIKYIQVGCLANKKTLLLNLANNFGRYCNASAKCS